MSLDRKRWALLAQDLKFGQLDVARKRAESWRTGLATLTTLLTGVLVVKGRDSLSPLTLPFQIVIAVLLGLALIALLAATLWVNRALAGPASGEFMLTGEDLEEWTRGEVRTIEHALTLAPWMAAASVLVIAAAVAVTWFAPARPTTNSPLVRIITSGGRQTCGTLTGATDRHLIITPSSAPVVIPLSAVVAITPVTACP